MRQALFAAALVNTQLWAAALMLTPKPLAAAFCAAFCVVWGFISAAAAKHIPSQDTTP